MSDIVHGIHEYCFTQNMVQTSYWADVSLIGVSDLWPCSAETRQHTDGFLITVFRLELAAALHQLCSEAASVSSSACWSLSLWNKVPVNMPGEVFYSAWWRKSWLHLSSYVSWKIYFFQQVKKMYNPKCWSWYQTHESYDFYYVSSLFCPGNSPT